MRTKKTSARTVAIRSLSWGAGLAILLLLSLQSVPIISEIPASASVGSLPPVLNDIARKETIFNTDFTSAGFGGMRGIGAGTITLSGVSGRVTKALLYWHGPTNSNEPNANSAVTFAGTNLAGVNIGFSADNNWSFNNSQAYRADVTSIVSGNGVYALANFRKPGVEINGASLIVFFDDGNNSNNRDVVLFDGNDSNQTNPFDANGWNVRLQGINYTAGNAKIELHVSDGQDFQDDALILNGNRTLASAGAVFQGLSVPNGPSASTTGGGLWDIRSFDVTPAFTPGPNTLTLTTGVNVDFLSLVVALIDLPAGAAPGPCGALDVALLIDDTGSMGSAIENVKTELLRILDNIVTASGNDYRIALVTFKDDVMIRENFAPNNRASVEQKIRALSAGGGGDAPEASDEAINTVVNALPAAGRRQNMNFSPAYRAAARKVLILVTDAPPGGFDDVFTPGVDDANARQRAREAASRGIRISAIFVPTQGDFGGQRAIMRDYAAISGGAFIETAPDGVGTGAAIMGIVTRCGEPPPPADVALSLRAQPDPVMNEGVVTYNITLRNDGPNPASDVVLLTTLELGRSLQSLSAPSGWLCSTPVAGRAGTISCTRSSLGNGEEAGFTLIAGITCSVEDGSRITQTALVTSTSDPNLANNSASVGVTVRSPASRPALTLAGGKSSMDFGSLPAVRELISDPPSDAFTVENSGCATVSLRFAINRIGADVAGGRIADTDDSALFPLRIMNTSGTESPFPIGPGSPAVQIPVGQRRSFRVQFNPLIPILAGKTTGLFANQVLPDLITSQLSITSNAGTPLLINLTGRISTPAKMIHPTDSRLAPRLLFTRSGDELTVECSTHDSNLDLYLARYQFLDQNDRPVGLPADVDLTQPIARRGLLRGQSFTIIQKFTGISNSPGIRKVQVILFDRETSVTTAPAILGATEPSLASVSAASFAATAMACESIVSAFGSGLAAGAQSAAVTPLPTSLEGVSVRVRDGAGTERPAPLFFVSPGQINFQLPAGSMVGAATVSVLRENQMVAREVVQITNASPGLFAANANGQGAAAAVALRIGANGGQQFEPVAQYDPVQKRFVTRPLDPGSASDRFYLVLFGTGVRFGRSPASVSVKIGGIQLPSLYAGAQGSLVGLDQINVAVPRSLAGRGEVDLTVTVDGKTSNPIRVNFGGSVNSNVAIGALTGAIKDSSPGLQSPAPDSGSVLRLPALKLPAPERVEQEPRRSDARPGAKTKEK